MSVFSVTPADELVFPLTASRPSRLLAWITTPPARLARCAVWQEKIRQREADPKAQAAAMMHCPARQKVGACPHLRYLFEQRQQRYHQCTIY
ncbi:hypothetical protein RAG37_11540 [Klebsiella pneumoniae]